MVNLLALTDPDASVEDTIKAYQHIINTGEAWRLEGAVGRQAMQLIERGECVLGTEGHRDYWGNRVPARSEVQEGTKGSVTYAQERGEIGPFLDV